MLIRSLYGSPLTNLIKYSMMLERKPVDTHFQSNFKLARDRIQKIMTEFKMTKDQGRKFFVFYPDVFKQNSTQFKKFKHRIELINKIAAEEGKRGVIGKVLQKNLFRTNHLAFNMSDKQINDLVSTVEKYFGEDSQIQKIFHRCPNIINPKFCEIFVKKLNILTDYLQIKPEQAMKLFEASPFLIPTSERKLRESLVTLSRKYNMNKQQMMKLMSSMGEVFMLGGPNLADTHKTPASWGLNSSQIKQTFLNHPLLFFNYPYNVMPFKLKILKHMTFTEAMAKKMMRDFPQILIWSIRSLEQKTIFIMNRLLLKVDEDTLELLKFNFNKTLRPRGEILIRSKQIYDKSNIVSFMELSDQQFVKKVDLPLQRLTQQKVKFPITREMDFKKSKVISYIGAKNKFIKLAQSYEH